MEERHSEEEDEQVAEGDEQVAEGEANYSDLRCRNGRWSRWRLIQQYHLEYVEVEQVVPSEEHCSCCYNRMILLLQQEHFEQVEVQEEADLPEPHPATKAPWKHLRFLCLFPAILCFSVFL